MKNVLILGCARSGTSLIGGIVSHLGIHMNQKENPSSQNPKGSFEDKDFLTWTSKIYLAAKNGNLDELELEKTQMMDCVKLKNQQSQKNWGFKSALTHMIWDHIDLSVFENLHLIFNYRSALQNARSWIVHMKEVYNVDVSLDKALINISESITTLSEVVKKTEHHKRYFTCYELVKDDPVKVSKEIADFLEIEFTPELEQEITNFVIKDYSTLK